MIFTLTKVCLEQSASSQSSAGSQICPKTGTHQMTLIWLAKGSCHSFSPISVKKLDTMTLGMQSKNGVRVSGMSQNGHALNLNKEEVLQDVTTRRIGTGLVKNTPFKMVFNTLEEAHSNSHGTTITEHSLRYLLRARMIARCISLRILIKFTLTHLQCLLQLYGSI